MSTAISIDLFDPKSIVSALEKLQQCKTNLEKNADQVMELVMLDAYGAAEDTAHVCTGDLVRNLRWEKLGNARYYLISDVVPVTMCDNPRRASEIRRGVHYAGYHEEYLQETEGVGYMEAASIEARETWRILKGGVNYD